MTVLVIIAAVTGGIKGVATAIVIQGIVMTVSVIILFFMGIRSTGLSYTGTIQALIEQQPEWFMPVKGVGMVFSFAFLWGMATFTLPHVTMTALTYKDSRTLHQAIKVGTVVVAIWLLGLNGLCFTIKYLFPEGTLATPDLGIPTLAVTAMPPWAAGLVLAGVCGAVQSSVGGMVVSLAGTFVSDVYSKLINPNAKPETVKKLNMCSIIVVAIIVFLFACDPPANTFSIMKSALKKIMMIQKTNSLSIIRGQLFYRRVAADLNPFPRTSNRLGRPFTHPHFSTMLKKGFPMRNVTLNLII